MSLFEDLQQVVGEEFVLSGEEATPFLTDWRGRFTGKALAVVRPANVEEIADVVRLCQQYVTPIVTQGGNTGLCGGATPGNKGDAVVLLTNRLNNIIAIDTDNDTITVEAGCILQTIQTAAEEVGRLFPLSLASEGSCTIGGNLATNAGGTQVVRYGNARDLTLGLQVVTAEGEIWNGLKGLRKDNTGYDLRDLFIGSEGTLGIITAATLKLFPKPQAIRTALLAIKDVDAAVHVLSVLKQGFGSLLTGFELISSFCIESVRQHLPTVKIPFEVNKSPWYVLIEISDHEDQDHANQLVEKVIGNAIEQGVVQDAIIAQTVQQSNDLWHIRESIPFAEIKVGKGIKHDIAIPISQVSAFIEQTNALLQERFPGVQHIVFGHLGDGNLHYNVGAPDGQEEGFLDLQKEMNTIVYDSVARFDGSISAEHGIGQLKKDILPDYKDEIGLALMRKIKRALDPNAILNPGKVISSVELY
ncbi:D-2-hydroxyacid dehydrogenase [Pelistega indica]|uniref:D-2-hydroxyacid dehydrogenase n=1 Tax=Pelistega indica TaxID=1414851 RepID=V8G831_9BURK|nr:MULTISPECIES: FAD-binding oxidoreductase [Pelistega]ETD72266.1 D-2-hydroxyacid dehydrogenase [Pelistega indica]